jgi:selenide,water dikinase
LDKILTKRGARPGDRLILTKPLGYGVITSAIKQQKAAAEDIKEVTRWMTTLNDQASRLAVELSLQGGTDVTGFGLLGHAMEMAKASQVGLRFNWSHIPFLENAELYAKMGAFPGGAFDNKSYFQSDIRFSGQISEMQEMLLFDPQTSGGLLLCVPNARLDEFKIKANERHIPFWEIGEIINGKGIEVSS